MLALPFSRLGHKNDLHSKVEVLMLALPIFTASHPATIVGAHVLNFCVRDGNRWTHMAINTNLNQMALTILYVNQR